MIILVNNPGKNDNWIKKLYLEEQPENKLKKSIETMKYKRDSNLWIK